MGNIEGYRRTLLFSVATDNRDTIITTNRGFVGSATSTVSTKARQLRGGIEWILDSGSSWHICTNKDLFITYEEYKPGEAVAEGHGDIILPIRKPDGSRYEMKLHCEYKPDNVFNLLGYIKAHREEGIEWSLRDMLIRDSKGEPIAYTFIAKNVPFIELADESFPVYYPKPRTPLPQQGLIRKTP